jgi:hypothetical protein
VAAALVIGGIILSPQVSEMFTNIGNCVDFDSASECIAGP